MNRAIEIRSGKLAEHLVHTLVGGIISRSKGYDILTRTGRRVEVRSRNKFTDGKIPRATVNESKMNFSDSICFIQFNTDTEQSIAVAIMIHTKYLNPLYIEYRQVNGVAHIPLYKVMSHPKSMDITTLLTATDIKIKAKASL